MKKILIAILVLAAAVSCNKENDFKQEEVTASFTFEFPEVAQTKAYSDGKTAKELHYAVYDGRTGNFLFGTTSPMAIDITTSVNIGLVKGHPYDIVFWAQAEGVDYYKFDKSAKTITVNNYTTDANDEKRDAFYQKVENYYYTSTPTTVKLYRPFAQINFFAKDYRSAQSMIGRTMKSKIKIKGIPNVLNVMTGEATGSIDADFKSTSVPAVLGEKMDGYHSYGYISMNYVMAHKEKDNFTKNLIGVFYMNGNPITLTVPNVPYQRNFRTNIIGSFFTGTGSFTVQIVPTYDPSGDHIVNH